MAKATTPILEEEISFSYHSKVDDIYKEYQLEVEPMLVTLRNPI